MTETCAAKLGRPAVSGMRVCGRPVVYLAAGERGNAYSGWYHEDRTEADHHAVPGAWVR